jgi:predicted nucleotidyltransferase
MDPNLCVVHAVRRLGFAMSEVLPNEWMRGLRSWASANKNVCELWLFGSRADGTSRPESDVDLGIGLMPPNGKHNWALGNFADLKDEWRRELEAIVGRHVSLENITPDEPGAARVRKWVRLWERE